MESSLNLALDYNGVMESTLGKVGLAPSRLQALEPFLALVRQQIARDRAAGVLGFVTFIP